MVPLVPKNNKTKKTKNKEKGAQAPPLPRLCDGVHLHQKQYNKKIKRRGAEDPHLSIVGDGTNCA